MSTRRDMILFIVISAFPSLVQAATVTAGSACHSITPSQATKFEWRTEGIKNSDAKNAWWVNCPIQRPTGTNEMELSLRVYNDSNRSIDFECNFREMFEGSRLQGSPVSANIRANSSETLTWVMTPNQAKSIVNAACRLPDGLQIEAILAGYFGDSSSGSGGGSSDVYACVTSPETTYYSFDDTVAMKNGAELNNYDGQSWYSSERHILFQTTNGRWYTIEDDAEIYRVDLVEEPDSCFEPDYFEVADRYAGGASGYILVIDGDEAEVNEYCDIQAGAQVYAYVREDTYPAQARVLDLLTARSCQIFDIN